MEISGNDHVKLLLLKTGSTLLIFTVSFHNIKGLENIILKYIDIIKKSGYKGRPMLVKKGSVYHELYEETEDMNFEVITTNTMEGNRVYERSIVLLYIAAVRKLFEGSRVRVEHSISKGLYTEIDNLNMPKEEAGAKIRDLMRKMVERKSSINRTVMKFDDAIKLFSEKGFEDKVSVFRTGEKRETIDVYDIEGEIGTFYGPLTVNCEYLDLFDVVDYQKGFVLMYPSLSQPYQVPRFKKLDKLYEIFRETGEWDEILGVSEVGALNTEILGGNSKTLVSVSEGLHEKKFAQIADAIVKKGNVRIVLIAGPSSSGKTTSSKRLSVQLLVNGIKPVPVEMDNYFVDREKTPLLPDGTYDYESIKAVDLEAFYKDISALINGQEVVMPKFNFKTGKREEGTEVTKLPENGVLIIEGIHGLNPQLLKEIDEKYKFRLYVSALTQLNLDHNNRVSTTDVRKLRRLIRDFRTRGYSSDQTLTLFRKVTIGEKKYIFPFQEYADAMFNTTLVYELPVLKKQAEPLLRAITEESENYHEAQRLLNILSFIRPVDEDLVPDNSVLREFIGKSFFDKEKTV